jgi:FtsZ-interacting cell division protein ZipA
MVPLDQLGYKPRGDAQSYLEALLPELEARAARFGGTARPESSVPAALAKMDRVKAMLRVRDYEVRIVVAAPQGHAYRVAEWWRALEGVGLEYGDGNLFWLYSETDADDYSGPYELFCAEPYSQPGYFHVGDLGGHFRFPDVALHFRVRDIPDPTALLHRMTEVAKELAARLGAVLLTGSGRPFALDVAEANLAQALKQLQALQRAEPDATADRPRD